MAIFEIETATFVELPAISLEEYGIKEEKIQQLLAARIETLDSGLLVLAREFNNWSNSTRRIDLLCLDTDANLVVIEIKRTDDGGHMELQALRYAAMVASLNFDQAVMALARSRNKFAPDVDVAEADILNHLGWSKRDQDAFGTETRIILASADFSPEIATTVLWLRERQIDIRCVRFKPYLHKSGAVLIDVQTIIPLPEVDVVKLPTTDDEAKKNQAERHRLRFRFWEQLLLQAKERGAPGKTRKANYSTWLPVGIGHGGFTLAYGLRQMEADVTLKVEEPAAYLKLLEHRAQIESEFQGLLDWQGPPNHQICYISCSIPGGYRSPESEWGAIQVKMIDAMLRLEACIRPRIGSLVS